MNEVELENMIREKRLRYEQFSEHLEEMQKVVDSLAHDIGSVNLQIEEINK